MDLLSPDWPKCACGCGSPAAVATYTNKNRGIRKGEPHKFARGHNSTRTQPGKPIEDRFWPKVREIESGCWEWTGMGASGGYGRIWSTGGGSDRKPLLAHRVAYELVIGKIPSHLTIDHLCRNRLCVNPAHLEAVTMGENVLRGYSPIAENARKTHCKYGHEFTPENTYRVGGKGGRICRVCNRKTQREYYKKNIEKQRRRHRESNRRRRKKAALNG